MEKTFEDMVSELVEYYECAGFDNFYERVLKGMNKEDILNYYKDTFQNVEDHEFEN